MSRKKPAFHTPLATLNVVGGKRLIEPLIYESYLAGLLTVPRGFETDLASFSIGNLALRGKTEEPAVVHDYLYSKGVCDRATADFIFREALEAKGVGVIRRNLYWLAVRIFGGSHFKRRRATKS